VIATVGLVLAVTLIASLALVAFDSGGPSPTTDPPPVRRTGSDVLTGAVEGKPTWDEPPVFALQDGVDYGAEIVLEGDETIVIDLFEEVAPEHVNNFVFLARQKFYDGLSFHEVLAGSRVRAGDPTAGDPDAEWPSDAGYQLPEESGAGDGGSALAVNSEGLLAMWRDDSGVSSSQFLITLSAPSGAEFEGFSAFARVTSNIQALYAFGTRDPGAIPPPPAGPKILEIRITEDGTSSTTTDSAPQSATQTAAGEPANPGSWDEPPTFDLQDGIDYRATIEMADGGVIEIDLYEELAPQHVNSFVFLARAGFYDSVTFHRIIHGFMAQGGDPTGTGAGGPGYSLEAEFNDTRHTRGILSMARSADPDSAGSQFFIVYDDAPHLDGQYTAFGEVISGMEVVDGFPERDPTDASAPLGPEIASITISEIVRAE
jgi:cyclophilin family peptidyl-prolyl cis-trans isomerase